MGWLTIKVERTSKGIFVMEQNYIAKGWSEYYCRYPNGRTDYLGDDRHDAELAFESKVLGALEAASA